MIQVRVTHPALQRALVDLLSPLAEVHITSATPGATALPAAVIISDIPLPECVLPVLALGAVELPLPVRAVDLLARVRQALQQPCPTEALTSRESALLAALAAAAPAPITRDSLLQQVWHYDPEVETHTIETHIYRLRQKLAAQGDARRILTVPGGYRLESLSCSTI
jgi:hypothetical protein